MTDNRQKILYIITKSVWGGATKYTHDLAINLPRDQFEVCAAAGGRSALYDKLKNTDVKYYEIKNFQKSINPLKEIFAFFEILRLIKNIRPDVVHTSSSKAGGLAGLAVFIYKNLMVSGYGLITVFTAHGWAYHENRPWWQKFLLKLFSRLTAIFYDKIITVSEYDRESAIENKIAPPEKLITIHNGIDPASINFLSKEEIIQRFQNFPGLTQKISQVKPGTNSELIIGTIGEFTKNKGHKFLIEAAAKLAPKHPDVKFVIIGHHGEEKEDLESRIMNYKLGNSVFLIDSPANAAQYLKAFDIFVLPSIKEGLPYVLLEAGLSELPVIASNVGGVPEIIEHKKTGLLIRPTDVKELISAIEHLAINHELQKTLAQNLNRKILQEFSFGNMLQKTIMAYKK